MSLDKRFSINVIQPEKRNFSGNVSYGIPKIGMDSRTTTIVVGSETLEDTKFGDHELEVDPATDTVIDVLDGDRQIFQARIPTGEWTTISYTGKYRLIVTAVAATIVKS